MDTYTCSQLSEETLKTLVTLDGKYIAPEAWEKMQIALTAEEGRQLEELKSKLRHRRSHLNFHQITTEYGMQNRSSNF